jgi:acyl-coenzyme A thioesterase PaaI-like protein
MPESFESRLIRWKFNLFPAYRGSGARVTYVSADFRELKVRLPLTWRSGNVVGTIFGGSMYAAVDPMYMIMLMQCLGRDYVVWDKAASIRFRRPGRTTLYATFRLDEAELDAIRSLTETGQSVDRTYNVDLLDAEGVAYASVEKVIYVRSVSKSQSLKVSK